MNKSKQEQNILDNINRMIDNKQYNLIFPDTLYEWILQDYKLSDRDIIINGLVRQGYLKKTKKGNAYIVINYRFHGGF